VRKNFLGGGEELFKLMFSSEVKVAGDALLEKNTFQQVDDAGNPCKLIKGGNGGSGLKCPKRGASWSEERLKKSSHS